MRKYTVLLLQPDTVANEFGHDTVLAWTKAKNRAAAIVNAQKFAAEQVDGAAEEDFHVLFACYGHQDNINNGR